MRLRALHVLESLAPGGMETTFLNVLRACREVSPSDRHDVLALAGGALEDGYRHAASQLTIANDPLEIARVLGAPVDLVHILFERCAYRLLPALLARTATPVVYGKGYDMGGMYRLNEGLRWQADESMLAACDWVTFTTPRLAAGFGVPRGRTTVLRKAADVRAFSRVPAPDASVPQRVVCVANLHPRKRLGDLITALQAVRRRVPGAELRFVGGGNADERERLGRQAAALGLRDAVSFAGQVHDVAAEVAQARIIALASSCEGVPTALLEGMAAARPVVATRVGHIESIVDDGTEGFLVAVGDVAGLASRASVLLEDPTLAATMGAQARLRAAAHDVRQVAADALEVWRATAASASTDSAAWRAKAS